MSKQTFLVLDFGSQLTQLIARRLRELNYYSEVHPYNLDIEKIKQIKPVGIILSGGPSSCYDENAPKRDIEELRKLSPLLGICYGMQLISKQLGGNVSPAEHREYGFNQIEWSQPVKGVPASQKVWMSHGDVVEAPPPGFEVVAKSESGHAAAIQGPGVWAVQFHPEVAHTENGKDYLQAWAKDFCNVEANWSAPNIVTELQDKLLAKVDDEDHILVALSGGVDSSVVATLLTRTFGAERVHCVFVDNGLLRKNEYEQVLEVYKTQGLNVFGVNARNEFLKELKDVSDPETKRKIIGRVFIEIFEKSIDPKWPVKWLAQGTLYPDVIESFSFSGGPSHTIKSHHNVGGLPEKMNLKLLEPVRDLFKDEVRAIGAELGLPKEMLWRHPFPGPGLAIRIIGAVDEKALQIVREADAIFIEQLRKNNLYHKIWQAFCVLTPVKTVGVQGDGRTYDHVLALRAVTSNDGMTADWYPFEFEFLRKVSNEITNKVKGVSRVVYDVTSKPPATIEWE